MKKWPLLVFLPSILATFNVSAEEPLDFVKRYMNEVDQNIAPKEYSLFWRNKVRTHLHDTATKLQKELETSVKMHELFMLHGSLQSTPKKSELQKDVLSYTYKLTKPISVNNADNVALLYPGWIYREFQITVEKEKDDWKISGEGFIGEENK